MASTPPPPPPPPAVAPSPNGPQKPPSPWWRVPLFVAGGIVLLGIGIGIGMGLTSGETPEETAASDTGASPDITTSPEVVDESPSPEPEPPAEPEGDYGLASCDLQLGPYQVIGSTRVENTGAVPIEVEVTFTWLFGDGSKREADPKTVSVGVGNDKLVFFKSPVTLDEAGSFQDHPDYFDSTNCKTRATILN